LGAAVLHGLLLAAVAILAFVLEHAVRREATARAEAAARAELERALLAESHHRVKNSLQTVADLLLLGRPSTDVGVAFDRTADRIRAIAVVHHLLGDRRGRAVTAEELLRYVVRAAAPGTDVRVEADDVLLAPAQAQQLGVIVNELITNAVGHGRPPIRVRFTDSHPALLEVLNANPSDPTSTEGLGLRLVRQVTEHGLHGTFLLDHDADGHAHARVHFPLRSRAHPDR
jgi:two-component sensor histidine kinase